MQRVSVFHCSVLLGLLSVSAYATPAISQLSPSVPSPQSVGTTVTWTATASDTDPGSLTYQYNVMLGGASIMLRDFSQSNSFSLTLAQREGAYHVQVVVLNTTTSLQSQLSVPFQINSLVVGTSAAVTPSGNPLVALLSAPSCPAGSFMRGLYLLQGQTQVNGTYWRACQPPASMNFYIAGMLANTTTLINYEVLTGTTASFGPKSISFHSGALGTTAPAIDVLVPPTSEDQLSAPLLLHDYINGGFPPMATDLSGNVMWYYPPLAGTAGLNAFLTRPLYLGTMLLIVNGANSANSITEDQILREIDFAGNTLRETNASLVHQKLLAMGVIHAGQLFGSFHHDAIRLSNGNTVVIGSVEQIFPPGTEGSTDPLGVDIIGDAVVVLNSNWQVVWGWNAFDHLDVNRAAVLGETCANGAGGCPPLFLLGQTSTNLANDWLHANSLSYVSSNGDLLLSLRHQDWVVKIDYNNGAGTGNVLWRLGADGDFTINSSDPSPWFSHQHDAAYENVTTGLISLFDDGNTRVSQNPGLTEHSRGQLLLVNETTKQVSLQLNADLGIYAFAVGSAQLLPNGNAHFEAGIVNPNQFAYSIEVLPNGTIGYEMQSGPAGACYRSWRMANLYLPPPN